MIFMQYVIRVILLTIWCVLSCSCVSQLNLKEGIASFKVQNYRQAFIRLLPEAKKGQPDAQYAVGYMYYYGQGVIENRKLAWKWINIAATAGQPEAIAARDLLSQGFHKP